MCLYFISPTTLHYKFRNSGLFIHVLQGTFQNAGNSPNFNEYRLVIKDDFFFFFCTLIFQALTLKCLLSLAWKLLFINLELRIRAEKIGFPPPSNPASSLKAVRELHKQLRFEKRPGSEPQSWNLMKPKQCANSSHNLSLFTNNMGLRTTPLKGNNTKVMRTY